MIKQEFTPEQIAEFAKCYEDPIYFIENYYKIQTLDKGLTQMKLYGYQKKLLRCAIKNRFTIAKLARQSGKTACMAAFICWLLIFNESYKILIVAHKESQAKEILKRIKLGYEYLPDWLKIDTTSWNEKSIEFINGSNAIISSTSGSAARGGSYNLVYVDEFCFVPQHIQHEFYTSVLPTISSGETSKLVITSTPNGLELFYKIWKDSENGKNDFKRIEIEWYDVPGRDEKWKAAEIQRIGEEKFEQEYNTQFLGSSHTLIDGKKIAEIPFETAIKEDECISLYKERDDYSNYMITVDCARGIKADYSALVVFDVTKMPYEVVMKYTSNKIQPLEFPEVILSVARQFNDAYVLIENNDVGSQVVDSLYYDYGYENTFGFNTKNEQRRPQLCFATDMGVKLGIKTSRVTKSVGCQNLKLLVESDQLIINDYEIINQMSRFVKKGTGYEADDGNDDLIMALVIFGWMSDQKLFRELTNSSIGSKARELAREKIGNQMGVFGFTLDDIEIELDSKGIGTLDSVNFDQWLMGDEYNDFREKTEKAFKLDDEEIDIAFRRAKSEDGNFIDPWSDPMPQHFLRGHTKQEKRGGWNRKKTGGD